MLDRPFWLCFSSRKLGDAARTWVDSKIWVVVQKLGEMIHFISPQHLQVRHILNVMASGPILPKVGKVNILWLFLLQFEILPATFAGRWEDNADFKVFLGKCKNLFPENILTKGNLTMTQKWGFAHWILLFLSKMEFSLIVEHSFVFNNPPNFQYWKDDWLSANQPSINKISLVAFIDINIKISITVSHLISSSNLKIFTLTAQIRFLKVHLSTTKPNLNWLCLPFPLESRNQAKCAKGYCSPTPHPYR